MIPAPPVRGTSWRPATPTCARASTAWPASCRITSRGTGRPSGHDRHEQGTRRHRHGQRRRAKHKGTMRDLVRCLGVLPVAETVQEAYIDPA
jgi:hypothetical protein